MSKTPCEGDRSRTALRYPRGRTDRGLSGPIEVSQRAFAAAARRASVRFPYARRSPPADSSMPNRSARIVRDRRSSRESKGSSSSRATAASSAWSMPGGSSASASTTGGASAARARSPSTTCSSSSSATRAMSATVACASKLRGRVVRGRLHRAGELARRTRHVRRCLGAHGGEHLARDERHRIAVERHAAVEVIRAGRQHHSDHPRLLQVLGRHRPRESPGNRRHQRSSTARRAAPRPRRPGCPSRRLEVSPQPPTRSDTSFSRRSTPATSDSIAARPPRRRLTSTPSIVT